MNNNADDVCRRHYIRLAQECRREGLRRESVLRSARDLSEKFGETWYLRAEAFQPTGAALGRPLPDRNFERRLNRVSLLVADRLEAMAGRRVPVFALVPPGWYHVTVVNRAHFQEQDPTITVMSPSEKGALAERLRGEWSPIRVHFNSLVLTRDGAVIVPGFPSDDALYVTRDKIVRGIPALGVHLPAAAHIKLGHVLVPLEIEQTREFMRWLSICGERVSRRAIFEDLYTPLGRIAPDSAAETPR